MLIETLSFEIRDFKNGTSEEYTVLSTKANFELVSAHRFTRGITFTTVFDFQFKGIKRIPKFIKFGEAVADALAENENVMNIDCVDEMVGTY